MFESVNPYTLDASKIHFKQRPQHSLYPNKVSGGVVSLRSKHTQQNVNRNL